MLKKLIAVSLVAAMALPVTGAFASSNPTDRVRPDIQNGIDSRITVAPGADEVNIMSVTWATKVAANIRATASPTGTLVKSVPANYQLHSQTGEYTVVNGVTWVYVWNDNSTVVGYILLSALTQTG
ncbi:hypothetical protein [Paenibacillus sp. 276b]|uniref:hypothetical protein n=1 Tax=Paenibacillus sp. 276b TaxID=1566277 RepID=UPI00089642B2|nr:hypothetical protein [Paenibacillus sp. 276b]SEB27630.1 hypothetical protein SAMN03159332_6298 [Paenibacillus sp. 276b]